jgi:hypothetical protein
MSLRCARLPHRRICYGIAPVLVDVFDIFMLPLPCHCRAIIYFLLATLISRYHSAVLLSAVLLS